MRGEPTATQSIPLHALDELARVADRLEGIRRRDVAPGDRLLVATRNSVYALVALADGSFLVSGGFYQRERGGSERVAVSGCTAGGKALFTSLVAAPGLFLEFADGTRTTRIRRVRHLPGAAAHGPADPVDPLAAD